MKYFIAMVFIIFVNHSVAQVIWPDPTAPCNTTLQDCIDSRVRGDVVEIHTNNPINESIVTTAGISVIAGTGFRPVFASGRRLTIAGTAHADLVVTISGLTFNGGGISYTAYGWTQNLVSTKLNITNNRIIGNYSDTDAIRINNFYTHPLELNIAFNHITYSSPASGLERTGAIALTNGNVISLTPSSGTITGRIYNNKITTLGEDSVGVGLYEFTGNSADLDVSSNTFIGGETAAFYTIKSTGSSGVSRIDFAHNAIYSNQIDSQFNGMLVEVAAGELTVNAINNTVIGAYDGFNFQETAAGQLEVGFYNNLVAYGSASMILNFYNLADSTITMNNGANLFYENDLVDPDFSPGSGFLTTNPMIKSQFDARLKAESPAIEAGNSLHLFSISNVPLIDADGLLRLKNGNPSMGGIQVDIGAYESGDRRVLDTLKGNPSNLNPIEDPSINFADFAKVQITQNLNPNDINLINGIDNDINMGVYRNGLIWTIFSQDEVSLMDTNVAFNVWNPAPSTQNYIHTAEDAISASESFTELDRSGLNNNPNAILSVTPLWEGLYNDNPVGVFYSPFTNSWNIYNSNLEDMPWMSKFNVYFQSASANAFIHRTSHANISADASYIDHPLLNNMPCAQFQITYDSGIVFEDRTGVFYSRSAGKWGVFIQSHNAMPEGAKFHVIVSAEQIAECNDIIFADDFE